MNWRRIRHIVRKEFLQVLRDPRLLPILLVAPLFQLFVFGYAVTTDVRHIATAIYDEDHTQASREMIARFLHSRYFDYQSTITSPEQVDRVLDTGEAQVVLHFPRHFAEDLASNRTATVQVILDGSDSMTAGIIAGYTTGVVNRYSSRVMTERLDRLRSAVARVPQIQGDTRVWYNPDLRSVNYMLPGVIGSLLLTITTILTSMAIVKERENGTLEQLIVTPITPGELMLGKTLPFAVIGFVNLTLVLSVATLWFQVPLRGSLLLLYLFTGAFLLASLGFGLFISTVSKTQQQAMVTGFFLMLPSFLLSGFMFPIENMPRVIQWVTYLLPLRYFLVIIRGIFLKGNGLEVLWPQAAALVGIGVAVLALSSGAV